MIPQYKKDSPSDARLYIWLSRVSIWRRHQTPTSSRPVSMLLQPIACYGVRFQNQGCPGLRGLQECRCWAVWQRKDWGSLEGHATARSPAHHLAWQARAHITRSLLSHRGPHGQPLILQVSAPPGTELCKSKGAALQQGMVLGGIPSSACETGELNFGRLFSFIRRSELFCCLLMAGCWWLARQYSLQFVSGTPLS